VQLGTSAILAVMGLAGLSSPSFASDLMFSLAALFGASALLGILAPKHSRGRGLLFGSVFLTALMVTYVYVVFRAGVPPGSKPTLTPWIPIAIALLAMTFAGLLAARITRNHTTGVSTAVGVMAVILAIFAQIATVAYVPAVLLAIMALIGFGIAAFDSARGRQHQDT
jgi:hypothetical protein